MPNKIKIVLTLVAMVAVFSVYQLAQYVHTVANSGSTLAVIAGTPLPNPDEDPDHDGLSNQQEMIWGTDPFNPDTDGDGFKDGEEVASGHNPLIPGPNDLLLTNNSGSNITDQVSTLVVSGLYAGVLDESDPIKYNQALSDISDSAILDSIKALDSNNISVNEPIKSSDSKESQGKYINAIGFIIQEELWGPLINEPRVSTEKFTAFNPDNKQTSSDSQIYFNTKAAYYKNVLNEIVVIPVPSSWLNIHQQITNDLRQLIISHQSLAQTDADPIKGAAALSNLMSLYQDVRPILTTIIQKIKENNLKPPNGTLWNLIVSLTNGQ